MQRRPAAAAQVVRLVWRRPAAVAQRTGPDVSNVFEKVLPAMQKLMFAQHGLQKHYVFLRFRVNFSIPLRRGEAGVRQTQVFTRNCALLRAAVTKQLFFLRSLMHVKTQQFYCVYSAS